MSAAQIIMARNTSGGGGGGGGGGYPVPGGGFYLASWPDSAGWSAQGMVFDPGSGAGSITNQTGGWIRRTYSGTWSNPGSGGNNNPSVFNGTVIEQIADSYGGFGTTSVNENYCMEWKGYFVPPATGTYNFLLDSDDVAMFWIGDGALNPESVGPICTSNNSNQLNPNSVSLTQNTAYPIRMRFQEWSGNERCQVFVGQVGTGNPLYAMQNWPSSVYYNGLTAGYNA